MSQTFSICEQVLFTFLVGPDREQWVEVTIGPEQRRFPLREFTKDMVAISEIALVRLAGFPNFAGRTDFAGGVIQQFPDELDYVNAQLHPEQKCGHFLESFFQSCLRADAENYQLLRPILREFMAKYPASPERLEAERRDRGASA